MISKESLKYLIWNVKFLSFLRCIPGYWDQDKEQFQLFAESHGRKLDALMSKSIIILNIFGHFCGIILHTILMSLDNNIRPLEIIMTIFFACIAMGAVTVYTILFKIEPITYYLNSSLKLNKGHG